MSSPEQLIADLEVFLTLNNACAGHDKAHTSLQALRRELTEAQDAAVKLDYSETQLIQERDHREEIINQLCDAVLGEDRYEWSSAYHFEDAVEDVEQAMAALTQPQEPHHWIVPDFGFLFPTEVAAQRYLLSIESAVNPIPCYVAPQTKKPACPVCDGKGYMDGVGDACTACEGRGEQSTVVAPPAVSWNLKYKDSTPRLNVGHSAFEDWFQQQPFATQSGIKQMCRDSYAAGMGDPLVTYATRSATVPTINASSASESYLLNGTRFKLSFLETEDDGVGNVGTYVTCFGNFQKELDGRWVALVAAENDCHLKAGK